MDLSAKLRKLARSSYWQNIYRNSKECSGIHLFENTSNFSGIQKEFLYWLTVYHMLYEELSRHESGYLTERVIDNDTRCDAYLYYRNRKIDFDWKQYQQNQRQTNVDSKRKKKFSEGERTDINVELRRK